MTAGDVQMSCTDVGLHQGRRESSDAVLSPTDPQSSRSRSCSGCPFGAELESAEFLGLVQTRRRAAHAGFKGGERGTNKTM